MNGCKHFILCCQRLGKCFKIFLNCTWFFPIVVPFSLEFCSGFLAGWNKTLNILIYYTGDTQYQYNDAQYPYNDAQYQYNDAQYPYNDAQYQYNGAQYHYNDTQYLYNDAQYQYVSFKKLKVWGMI